MLDYRDGKRGGVEFRVLGTLEAAHDGEPIDLGPLRQRSLLALLLIHANRVVATDRILEELWGDDAVGKENALWVYISRLRSVLEPDRQGRGESTVLVTRDHGYMLSIEPESIDAHRFEASVNVGRSSVLDDPSKASSVLREAADMWRGRAYEDFAYDEFAQAEISRLEELRLEAIEGRIEADLRRGQAGELVGELEALHQDHPLRERFVSQLMLALYRSGRQAESLRTFERFRRHVGEEMGIEPSPELCRLEEQVLLHDSRIQARRPSAARSPGGLVGSNPFKGLQTFLEHDSPDFFGRDRLLADIVRRLEEGAGLLALVGPSGSGKSSAVRAGLIPALRKGAIEGSDRWLIAQMVPGSQPFAELEAALLRSSLDAPDSLSEQLADPEVGILRAALRVLPDDQGCLVLVIDQFEELFTLVDDEQRRSRFLANLLTALDDSRGRVVVVLTLRADFYDRPLAYPEFGSRMGSGVINVVPLSPDELEVAAQRPAQQAGVSIEPALLAALLTDVVGRPGGLPLFQYTLTELFDRRVGDLLTLDTYRSIGGVGGALTKRAEDLYSQLDDAQRQAAGQLFLRLVTITKDDEWGRRRVPASEMVSLDVDVVALQAVIELYAAHRLLTLDRDFVSGSPTVEVAHEALLTEWDRLRDWIADGREDVRRHASLRLAMEEWIEADRNADFLLSGSRLERYEEWSGTAQLQLNAGQRGFLEASIAARDLATQVEQERLETEARTARSARRRLWGLAAAVTVLVAVAIIWGVVALGPAPATVAMFTPSDWPESMTDLMETGFARAERELDVEVELLTGRFSDVESEYRNLAESGTDLIIVDSNLSVAPWLEGVIADYPDTAFALIDPFFVMPTGALSVGFANQDAAYLAGLAAALTTESGVVGFVGGAQVNSVTSWRAGFESGVWAVDSAIDVLAIPATADTSGFADTAAAKAAGTQLFESGADVILAVAADASLGVVEAAWEQSESTGTQRWAITPDSDWWPTVDEHLRPHVLTSAIKGLDVAVFETIKTLTEGEFEPGIRTLTLADGAFSLTSSGEYMTEDQLSRIADLSATVISGQAVVPEFPEGEILAPPGVEVAERIAVTWDGTTCSYGSELTTLDIGTAMRLDFTNSSSGIAEMAVMQVQPELELQLVVPTGPQSGAYGFAVLGPGSFEVSCLPSGLMPWERTTGAILTAG
ncbi:MAG: BTAD domain-containing putative transcriptional regulator [Acidimicrobiia bacterium]|nr:BTAD domain-containing putative transcriptional regulator [Acidimicrobiia bacterium]